MSDRGVARKLSASKLLTYDGLVFYLSHHEVFKLDSIFTPCRIVLNSSDNFIGHILSNYWASVPNLLNNILGILISFRENQVALTGDITKMYHIVEIPINDQHTDRFLWRDMQTNQE